MKKLHRTEKLVYSILFTVILCVSGLGIQMALALEVPESVSSREVYPINTAYNFTGGLMLNAYVSDNGDKISAGLTNSSGQSVDGFVFLAVYDKENGRLVVAETGEIHADAGAVVNNDFSITAAQYPHSSYDYKIFCWDAHYVPLTQPIDVKCITLNWDYYPLVVGDAVNNGDTIPLIAKIADPDTNKISWTSSDESVATVTGSGVVQAYRSGFCDVTATLDNGACAVCHISVIDNYSKFTIQYINFNSDELYITPDSSLSLPSVYYPNPDLSLLTNTQQNTVFPRSFTWTTSDSSVATVSGGTTTANGTITANTTITAVGPGTAVISITSNFNGRTARCTVHTGNFGEVSGIALDKTSQDMKPYDTVTLTASGVGGDLEKGVSWISSNPYIANVDSNGKVTAYSNGTAIITATSKQGGYKASFTANLTEYEVLPYSVSLSNGKVNLAAETNITLTAAIVPANTTNQTVKWSSSNPLVATVREGDDTTVFGSPTCFIEALSPGSATITAQCGGKTAQCIVTVTDDIVSIKSVTLSKTEVNIDSEAVIQLDAAISPANVTSSIDKVVWISTDRFVAPVNVEGIIKANRPGTAEVYAVSKAAAVAFLGEADLKTLKDHTRQIAKSLPKLA